MMGKYRIFIRSIVWIGAVTQWIVPGAMISQVAMADWADQNGAFSKPRSLGQADTSVCETVCNDLITDDGHVKRPLGEGAFQGDGGEDDQFCAKIGSPSNDMIQATMDTKNPVTSGRCDTAVPDSVLNTFPGENDFAKCMALHKAYKRCQLKKGKDEKGQPTMLGNYCQAVKLTGKAFWGDYLLIALDTLAGGMCGWACVANEPVSMQACDMAACGAGGAELALIWMQSDWRLQETLGVVSDKSPDPGVVQQGLRITSLLGLVGSQGMSAFASQITNGATKSSLCGFEFGRSKYRKIDDPVIALMILLGPKFHLSLLGMGPEVARGGDIRRPGERGLPSENWEEEQAELPPPAPVAAVITGDVSVPDTKFIWNGIPAERVGDKILIRNPSGITTNTGPQGEILTLDAKGNFLPNSNRGWSDTAGILQRNCGHLCITEALPNGGMKITNRSTGGVTTFSASGLTDKPLEPQAPSASLTAGAAENVVKKDVGPGASGAETAGGKSVTPPQGQEGKALLTKDQFQAAKRGLACIQAGTFLTLAGVRTKNLWDITVSRNDACENVKKFYSKAYTMTWAQVPPPPASPPQPASLPGGSSGGPSGQSGNAAALAYDPNSASMKNSNSQIVVGATSGSAKPSSSQVPESKSAIAGDTIDARSLDGKMLTRSGLEQMARPLLQQRNAAQDARKLLEKGAGAFAKELMPSGLGPMGDALANIAQSAQDHADQISKTIGPSQLSSPYDEAIAHASGGGGGGSSATSSQSSLGSLTNLFGSRRDPAGSAGGLSFSTGSGSGTDIWHTGTDLNLFQIVSERINRSAPRLR